MIQVSIAVNGKTRKAQVEPRTLLVHFLREQLNLTGTHVGCDTSQCGACTVLIDGRSAKSCTIFAVQAMLCRLRAAMYVLNFYSPLFVDQLKRGRKTATIRLGDKSAKYKKGHVVLVTVGFQHSPREKIFDAVIDGVEVKKVKDLSPRDIEHDNPEFRRLDETVHFLEQIYGRPVDQEDLVTVVRFSAVLERPSEISDRLRKQTPAQN